VVCNYGDIYKASALSLRERVAEGRVRVVDRNSRTTLTRASRTLSRRERAPALHIRHITNADSFRFTYRLDEILDLIFNSALYEKVLGTRASESTTAPGAFSIYAF
jgi:hypothetical protein